MVTEFQQRVFDAICEIPDGSVSTYKFVARRIGCRSSQAVGQALRRNPFAPRVPCHRVIATSLRIGGFGGETAGAKIRKKIALLKKEGVHFGADGQLAEPGCVYDFSTKG